MHKKLPATRKSFALLFLPIIFGPITLTANAEGNVSGEPKQRADMVIPHIPARYEAMVQSASEEFDIPVYILASFMIIESGGNPYAESATGARGLMQITTKAFLDTKRIYSKKRFTDDLWDPGNNIRVAAAYISILRDIYGFESISEIAVAYNKGPRAAKKLNEQAISTHFYAKRVKKVLTLNADV